MRPDARQGDRLSLRLSQHPHPHTGTAFKLARTPLALWDAFTDVDADRQPTSGLHGAAAGTAEAGQAQRDLAEQGSDLARAVILELAHSRARPAVRPPGRTVPALCRDDSLLDQSQKLLALRQGYVRSRDV